MAGTIAYPCAMPTPAPPDRTAGRTVYQVSELADVLPDVRTGFSRAAMAYMFAVFAVFFLAYYMKVSSDVSRVTSGIAIVTTLGSMAVGRYLCKLYVGRLTGMKLVIVYAFIADIAGEFLLSDRGIGHEIAFAYNNFDNASMYGLILLVIALVLLLSGVLKLVRVPGSRALEAV